jgi:hypothetical protein
MYIGSQQTVQVGNRSFRVGYKKGKSDKYAISFFVHVDTLVSTKLLIKIRIRIINKNFQNCPLLKHTKY